MLHVYKGIFYKKCGARHSDQKISTINTVCSDQFKTATKLY